MARNQRATFPHPCPTGIAKSRRGRPRTPRRTKTSIAAQAALADRLSESSAAAWRAVHPGSLRNATRSTARIVSARQTAIYFSHVFFGATLTRAARIFGRDRTTARHACYRVEDWRDDQRIDRVFDHFEPALRRWLGSFSTEIHQ